MRFIMRSGWVIGALLAVAGVARAESPAVRIGRARQVRNPKPPRTAPKRPQRRRNKVPSPPALRGRGIG
jgi:hypothetical protein